MENIFHMWWPVLCIVFSDVIYQICAKKMSTHTDPLAALGITYLVSAGVCVLLYALSGGDHLLTELGHVPWPAVGIGLSVTGLEVGCVSMYKAGWAMNIGFIFYTAVIVLALLAVGFFFYGETLTFLSFLGILTASAGMFLIVKG